MHADSKDVGRCTEPEITESVDLCRPDGTLDRAAVGWSRRPLHRCNLRGRWGRKKRWDYWAITSQDCLFALTFADLDYLGLYVVQFLDWRSGRLVELPLALPFAPGLQLPDTVAGADIRFAVPGLSIEVIEAPNGTQIKARGRTLHGVLRADIFVAMPDGHETLGVVIPWSDRLFQYTSKHNTRPAQGFAALDGKRYEFGAHNQSFGCLDYGRGIWPYEVVWNWASASGIQDGHVVGLQLGGKWTDGTGMTESALCIGGRLHKISEPLDFRYDRENFMAPWQIGTPSSRRVALTFTPFHDRRNKLNLGIASTEIHQMFGHFSGTITDDSGDTLRIRDLLGWAEEHRARW